MQVLSLKKDILTDKSDVLLVMATGKDGHMAMTPSLRALDKAAGGAVAAAAEGKGFSGKAGEMLSVYPVSGNYRRIILAGRGETAAESAEAATAAAESLDKAESLTVLNADFAAATAVAGTHRFKLGALWPADSNLKEIKIAGMPPSDVTRCMAVGEGLRIAQHLAEQPGNVCTPSFLARTAQSMQKKIPALNVKVFSAPDMKKMRMGAFLGVSAGSAEPPKMIVMQYKGAAGPPVVLVGKGVTFDTGGISLKPAASMEEMKFDMGGAASVLGALWACARMKIPLHVAGVVPACENMPGGRALKPGDVIHAMNGKSIEVQNTDAEGRLILADALSYCDVNLKPETVVDVATLTGACVIALGHHLTGMTSRHDGLARELLSAGEESGDGCWRLPMGGKYDKQLESKFADMSNIGGRPAGTVTAATFLSHFVKCEKWAHLDIAGTAWTQRKRATGRPLPLLAQFLMSRAKARRR